MSRLPLAVSLCLQSHFVYFLPCLVFDFIDFFRLLDSLVLRVFSFDPQPLSTVSFYFICSSTALFFSLQCSSFISGNACYHSVQKLLSSRLLSQNLKIRIYKIIILPVVLYGCETWSLTLREEHRLRVLRRIFGPKRDEVTRSWKTLHNEELHNLYSSQSIIKMIKSRRVRLAGHVARMGEERNVYRILVGKPEGRRPLLRPRRSIRMDLREIGWDCMDWIDLAQDRDQCRALVNTIMKLRVP
ncbi:hypothetical protein B7P43_G15719 [Cryptotermes secundus]|uniref:Uncharacterized protein n=1 Tax=Cryptotermes secundus TaxID=105785 RepID=A0A2J7PV85_9NEOP|nr:hypothetical protein B7P43_G15719 [Cryptotermes secundus]